MLRTFLRAAAVSLVCCSGSAFAQSPVGNGGFETDIIYDAAPVLGNWAAFFGGPPSSVLDASRNQTAPNSGSFALHMQVSGDGNAFCGVQQPISGIQPGVSYTMRIRARRAGNVNNGVEYRIEWKDANGAFIGDQFGLNTPIAAQLTDTYQTFSLPATAPAGAAAANLVMAVQSFTFNPVTPVFDTQVFVDDVEFSADATPGQGACCLADGSCQVALIGACPPGSTQQAAGTTCSPNTCPPPVMPGACCNPETGACVVTMSSTCGPLGGSYQGDGSSCSPNPCQVTSCAADFNNSGNVSVQDIFDFLSAYFAGCP